VEGCRVAAAALEAIVPWEGFTDAYRDLLRPGGIREVGFVRM
jgi:predicted acyl esterase